MENEYLKYRGKCKEFSEKACKIDPTLTLVRGFYYDPIWGKEQHWWTKRPDGTIYDPTRKQFPSKGKGVYVEFDGFVTCEICNKRIREKEAIFQGRFPTCSDKCAMSLLGF